MEINPLQFWLRTNVMTKTSLKACILMFSKIFARMCGVVDIISVGLVLLLHGDVGAGLNGITCEDFSMELLH